MKSARVCRRDGCADDHVIRQLRIARQTKHYLRYTHTQCIIASHFISMQVTILPALAPSTMDVRQVVRSSLVNDISSPPRILSLCSTIPVYSFNIGTCGYPDFCLASYELTNTTDHADGETMPSRSGCQISIGAAQYLALIYCGNAVSFAQAGQEHRLIQPAPRMRQ